MHGTTSGIYPSAVGSPTMTSSIDALRAAACAHAQIDCPWAGLRKIVLVYDDGEKSAVHVRAGARHQTQPAQFSPTGSQLKLVAFLATGPKLPKQCKDHMGGSLYGRGGVLSPLMAAGLVEKCPDGRYKLTPEGEELAETVEDEI